MIYAIFHFHLKQHSLDQVTQEFSTIDPFIALFWHEMRYIVYKGHQYVYISES